VRNASLDAFLKKFILATHCNTLQHTVTRCNTLQHAATRCNTLQHAAIREKCITCLFSQNALFEWCIFRVRNSALTMTFLRNPKPILTILTSQGKFEFGVRDNKDNDQWTKISIIFEIFVHNFKNPCYHIEKSLWSLWFFSRHHNDAFQRITMIHFDASQWWMSLLRWTWSLRCMR